MSDVATAIADKNTPKTPDVGMWGGLLDAIGSAIGGVIEAAGAASGNKDVQTTGKTTRAIFTPGSDVSATVKGSPAKQQK